MEEGETPELSFADRLRALADVVEQHPDRWSAGLFFVYPENAEGFLSLLAASDRVNPNASQDFIGCFIAGLEVRLKVPADAMVEEPATGTVQVFAPSIRALLEPSGVPA